SGIQVSTFSSATGTSLTVAIPRSVLDALVANGLYKTAVTERPTPEGTDPVGVDQITITVRPAGPAGRRAGYRRRRPRAQARSTRTPPWPEPSWSRTGAAGRCPRGSPYAGRTSRRRGRWSSR
ncbi:hypothetical protein ACFWAP_32720, partial [Streptomyces goshikiensis]|uniref:hypothetical protein n=1 Tax=Streptomyces goshikiensis TaxID=1942 RepID=UPI0036671A06